MRDAAGTLKWAALGAAATAGYIVLTSRTADFAEDAAILVRYAWHLGQGLGFVWNPGEGPVDGATDWLGTTLLGGLYALGVPLDAGPRLLGAAAHCLSVALAIIIMLEGFGAPLLVAIVSAAFIAVGPARAYIEAGFLTPVFALGVLAAWGSLVFADRAMALRTERAEGRGQRAEWKYAVIFAGAMLFATLTRPEGLGVTVILLAAGAFVLDRAALMRFAMATVAIFGTIFTAFVLWRWRYFGRLLPLPFLKKGGGALHWDGLLFSLRGVIILIGWLMPFLAIGLRPGRPFRWLVALVVFVGGFAGMWIMLSPEMDYYYRFQYAVVPVAIASAWVLWMDVRQQLAESWSSFAPNFRRAAAAAVVVAIVGGLVWQHRRFVPVSSSSGLKIAGVLLNRHGESSRLVVTTEAGLVPLYSRWRAVDAWGLNDARIVRDGELTEQYLDELHPDAIVFHAYFTPTNPRPRMGTPWNAMVSTLHQYALCHGFSLAAVFAGGIEEAHYYYVRPDWPGAQAFTRDLRNAVYTWPGIPQTIPEVSSLDHHACGVLSSQ